MIYASTSPMSQTAIRDAEKSAAARRERKGERRAVARKKSAPQASSHAKGGIVEAEKAGKAAKAESRKAKRKCNQILFVQCDH